MEGDFMYKIMIIEDEDKIKDILADSVQKWGFEIYTVKNFSNVFEEFIKENPTLFLWI